MLLFTVFHSCGSWLLRSRSCPLPVPIGSCLSLRWAVWRDKGADPWMVEVLRWGYQIPFSDPPPLSLRELFPWLDQGESSSRGDPFAHNQGSCRTHSSLPGLLQSPLLSLEDLGLLAPGYRPFSAERVCAANPIQDGNQSVGPPIRQEE